MGTAVASRAGVGPVAAEATVADGDLVEVRLLGTFHVRRRDGRSVDAREWRTVKNADLLRLLALAADRPVPVSRILDALWPAADEAAGRASLRTAMSQLRRILGDVVERHADSLMLTGAWVDTQAFTRAAEATRAAHSRNRPAEAIAAARRGDALYLGELRFGGDDASLAAERDALQARYRMMLAVGADAANEAGWYTDALEFGHRLLAVEPCSEHGYRMVMTAHAGLGDTGAALREYVRCRTVLSEELGVDPSAQTRDLHAVLLTGLVRAAPRFVGRHAEVQQLRAACLDGGAAPRAVLVVGAAGTGAGRLIAHAAAGLVRPPSVLAPEPGDPLDVPAAPAGPGCLLVRLRPADAPAWALALAAAGWQVSQVVPTPLSTADVREVAGNELGGEVDAGLVDDLVQAGDGTPGRILGLLRSWAAAGRIDVTDRGVCVRGRTGPGGAGAASRGRSLLAGLQAALPEGDLAVLRTVAAAGEPLRAEAVAQLVSDPHELWAGAALSRLEDRGVLVGDDAGFAVADQDLRAAVLAYLRPSARRRLVRLVSQAA